MPGKTLPIHIATSLNELNEKHIKVNDAILTKASPIHLMRTTQKLYETAEEKLQSGDEEAAYIHFMKFLHIAQYAQQAADHKKLKDWQPLLDRRRLGTCMQKAELLADNLKQRYEKLKKIRQQNKPVSPEVKMETPPPPTLPTPQVAVTPKLPNYKDKIECRQLYELMKRLRGDSGVLVLDARPQADYTKSHIDERCAISVPEEIIIQGCSASKLQAKLPESSLTMWEKRANAEYVVLMDWSSHLSQVIPSSKLHILRSILEKWDVNTVYKRPPIVLEGGFEDWLSTYPFQVTDPTVKPPSNDFALDDLLLDDIEYPTWNDPQSPKPATLAAPLAPLAPSIPSVDRALKPSSAPAQLPSLQRVPSEESPIEETPPSTVGSTVPQNPSVPIIDRASKQKAVERMQQENKLKTQKVLEVQEKRLQAEKGMEELRQRKFEEADQEMVKMREEAYLQEIDRLEHLYKASILENTAMKEELEKLVASGGVTASTEISQQIINTEAKLNAVTQETDALVKQRQKAGQVVPPRSTKPSVTNSTPKSAPIIKKPPSTGEKTDELRFEALKLDAPGSSNLIRSHSSPNIKDLNDDATPQFDRGSKPTSRLQNHEHLNSRTRDFSPVYGNKGRGLTGLKNLGNSCYMNSIVQCISNTTSLMQYFCEGAYRNDVNGNPKTRGQIVEELAAVVRALWGGEYRAIACRDFKRVAGSYHGDFAGFRQQDSHEFLTLLMDWLHDDLNKRRHVKPPPSPASSSDPPEPVADLLEQSNLEWSNFLHCNDSRIQKLFYGQQSSTVRCSTCMYESVTFEPFSSLTLVLPDKEKCSLEDCLRIYLKAEYISEWKCPRCKQKRDAMKKFDIWRLPPILIIHFKRFIEDVLWRKQHTMVDFPLNELDMHVFTPVRDQTHMLYQLYAVSNHYGTMDGGHYTSYSRSSAYKKWYKFDDADVSEISENSVRSNAAYILFYASVKLTSPRVHSMS